LKEKDGIIYYDMGGIKMDIVTLNIMLVFFFILLFIDLFTAYKKERSGLDDMTREEILKSSYQNLRNLVMKNANIQTYIDEAVMALDDFIKAYKDYNKINMKKHINLKEEAELEEKALQMKIMGGILLSRLRSELKNKEEVPLSYKLLETDLNELREMIII
jgi:hypothetical protein